MVYGAKLDYRNTNRQIVTADKIVNPDGTKNLNIKVLEHSIHCPACGHITRKVR